MRVVWSYGRDSGRKKNILATLEIFIWGAIAQGFWGQKSPSGVRGEVPQEAQTVRRHFFTDYHYRDESRVTFLLVDCMYVKLSLIHI